MRPFARLRFVSLGLVALAALLALAGPAEAKSDKVIRDDYAGSATGLDVCGLTVDVAWQGTFRATIHDYVIGPNPPPADDFWIGNINDHGSQVWTNEANGKSVVQSWTNNIKEASLVYVGDGNWVYTRSVNGIAFRLGGKPIDVGRIVVVTTIHFGDLSTDADDAFVSEFASFDAGRHPSFYDQAAFCDPLVAAIG